MIMKVDESCGFNVCILLFGVKEKNRQKARGEKLFVGKSFGNGHGSFFDRMGISRIRFFGGETREKLGRNWVDRYLREISFFPTLWKRGVFGGGGRVLVAFFFLFFFFQFPLSGFFGFGRGGEPGPPLVVSVCGESECVWEVGKGGVFV